jgi:hypothetical protein
MEPKRQKAYSDSHIQLPRNLANPGIGLSLQDDDNETEQSDEESPHLTTDIIPDPPVPTTFSINDSTVPFYRIRTVPSSLELMAAVTTTNGEFHSIAEPANIGWTTQLHTGALHLVFHLLLISLFETLFFWLFISQQEDEALTGLVNTYTDRAFSPCSNMTAQQRTDLRIWVSFFLNTSTALSSADAAAADRHILNGILIRNSWLYFGGLTTTFGLLVSTALLRRLTVRWGHLVGENLGLVAMLGLYEWMFFRTVALQYHAITPAELDGMIIREFEASC